MTINTNPQVSLVDSAKPVFKRLRL